MDLWGLLVCSCMGYFYLVNDEKASFAISYRSDDKMPGLQAFKVVYLWGKFGGHFGILFLCFSSKQNVVTTKLRAKGHEENCEKMIDS